MKKICCFAGHSELCDTDNLLNDIKTLAEELIINKNVEEFWVGNYGDFDNLSARAVRELKKSYSDIRLNLIIPYLTVEISEYKILYDKNYDNILIADIPEKTPHRYRITKCNQYMIKNSQFLICYIEHHWGGAAKTLEYAKKQKSIEIFNLGER